jgi:sec-independent protein translocase protein TatC
MADLNEAPRPESEGGQPGGSSSGQPDVGSPAVRRSESEGGQPDGSSSSHESAADASQSEGSVPAAEPPPDPEDGGGEVKSFLEHLEDLRWVLIKSGTALVIAMIVCLLAGNQVVKVLIWPLERSGANITLLFLDPAGPFIASLHLALFGGMILGAPFIFYYIVEFVMPALKIKEKKYFRMALTIGGGLFMIGVFFSYFIIMPLALNAAIQYSHWLLGPSATAAANQWRAETYFSFVSKFMLGMGLGFELPVVLLTLVKIGILDHRKLAAFRRYMIVLNLILGALLTTPEVLTQVLMAVPLQVLYEISVWIAWYWERQAKRRLEAAEKSRRAG